MIEVHFYDGNRGRSIISPTRSRSAKTRSRREKRELMVVQEGRGRRQPARLSWLWRDARHLVHGRAQARRSDGGRRPARGLEVDEHSITICRYRQRPFENGDPLGRLHRSVDHFSRNRNAVSSWSGRRHDLELRLRTACRRADPRANGRFATFRSTCSRRRSASRSNTCCTARRPAGLSRGRSIRPCAAPPSGSSTPPRCPRKERRTLPLAAMTEAKAESEPRSSATTRCRRQSRRGASAGPALSAADAEGPRDRHRARRRGRHQRSPSRRLPGLWPERRGHLLARSSRAAARRDAFFPDAHATDEFDRRFAIPRIKVLDITAHPEARSRSDASRARVGQACSVAEALRRRISRSARALVENATRLGLKLAVNQNGRWAPHLAYMREAVAAGLVGTVTGVRIAIHWSHGWMAGTPFDEIDDLHPVGFRHPLVRFSRQPDRRRRRKAYSRPGLGPPVRRRARPCSPKRWSRFRADRRP